MESGGTHLTVISYKMLNISVFDMSYIPYGNELTLLHLRAIGGREQNDVIKWKHFPRNWSFVKGIDRSPVDSPQEGQWLGALMVSLICPEQTFEQIIEKVGNLRRHRAHYDVFLMVIMHTIHAYDTTSPRIFRPQDKGVQGRTVFLSSFFH